MLARQHTSDEEPTAPAEQSIEETHSTTDLGRAEKDVREGERERGREGEKTDRRQAGRQAGRQEGSVREMGLK